MDPNETFEMMLAAIAAGNDMEASEHATALHEWMRGGGFAPALSLADRFNQAQPIDRELIAALVESFRPSRFPSNSSAGPSPLDD